MNKLTIVDIRNRLRSRLEGEENFSQRSRYERLAETAINSGFPSQIKTVIEYGLINNDRLSLDTMCGLFDALSECETESQIRKYGNMILKEYVSRVRDAKETQTYLKRKLGRAKTKTTTKVQNNFDDIKDAFNQMIGAGKKNFQNNVASMKNTAAKVFPNNPLAKKKDDKEKAKKEAAWIEAYENMVEESTRLIAVDRILENYNRISKRFNIDRIIQENTVVNGVIDTIVELCNLIDTYDMPVKARYNTCLETCWYGFHKNSFEFNESDLVSTVTDYYMAHGKNGKACASILENSVVFDKKDYLGDMEVLTEEEPEEDEPLQEGIFGLFGPKKSAEEKDREKYPEAYAKFDYINKIYKAHIDELKPIVDKCVKKIDGVKVYLDKPPVESRQVLNGKPNEVEVIYRVASWYNLESERYRRDVDGYYDYDDDLYAKDMKTIEQQLNSKLKPLVVSFLKKYKLPGKVEVFSHDDYVALEIRIDSTEMSFQESAILEVEFKNDKGEEVPKVCPKCGSKVGVFFRGEPIFLCSNKDCEEYFGTVPFKEAKLSAADRAKLKDSDYGIPSKKKYPMPDESHIRSAIQMFNHVDKEDEAELAKNIKKKIKKYGMSVDVGKDNRFSKYYEAAEDTGVIRSEIREAMTYNTGYMLSIKEETDFNKIFNDFKASNQDGKETKLKFLINKLYSTNVENVVEGTPNLLAYIRNFFIIGTFAVPVIGPFLGIITFIADKFVALHMDRKNTEQMRTAFQNEIRATTKKIESSKSEENKKRLEEYKKSLTEAYNKIDEYYEGLLSDAELDAKYDAADDDDIKGGDSFGDFGDDFGDDFDFGDNDDDFDFNDDDFDKLEEAAKFIPLMSKLCEAYEITCPEKTFDQEKCHKMLTTAPSIVKDLGDVAVKFPSIIPPDELKRAIEDTKSDVQIGRVKVNMVERYDLQNTYDDLLKVHDESTKINDIFYEARHFACEIEIIRALNEVYSSCVYYSPITEASFLNSLKLASEKIKKGIQKLSDKDREISKNIDVSVNNVKKSAERALEADNREAIIKGSVLPSASKVLKLAIANAAIGIVAGPAAAVIATLGYLGVSKVTKEKQRRAILDEIEIELKMCQKYIDLAESKNDLKALKNLYTIQRNLERQRAKVKFHLQVKGEKYHDPKDFGTAGIET